MRKNYPVYNKRYPVHSHQTLISITDLKGRITYCNDDFIEVSGFTKEEMYGKAHNIVRHPDVPKEIFHNFWQVINKGGIWTGIIKNRRKNGEYYWVRANATALIRDGKPIGYLSVRTSPTPEEIKEAERVYEKIGPGDEKSKYTYRNGRAVRKGLPGHLGQLIRQSTNVIKTGAPVFIALGLLLAGTYVFSLPVLIVLLFLLSYLVGNFYLHMGSIHTRTVQRVLSPLAGGN